MTQQALPQNRLKIWLLGMAVGDVSIGILYGGAILLMKMSEERIFQQIVGIPSFFLMPILGGVIASYLWRHLRPGIGATALGVLWMMLLAIVGAALVFHEGAICLLIVSPLFYVIIFAGALMGRVWFRVDSTRFRLCIFPLLALAIIGEPMTREPHTDVVVDEVLIHAPPSRVWRALTAFPAIKETPRFWLFRMGLPYPVATTSAGDFVGADRSCIFSDDMVFKEKVAQLIPHENLTFDITELPKHPELIGHLTPYRGQFLLCDNGDGTTTLTGSTWYTLHVRPLWYFDLWTQYIFRAVHERVMDDIRRRAETPI
ncbi:MAG: hypothetical protein ABI615_02365 [Chthoniobacterales bacterium]